MATLNEMETKVFLAIVKNILDCTGGEFGFADEAYTEELGITKRQFSGYCASLSKKGLYDTCDDEYRQTTLSNAGAELYRELADCPDQYFTTYDEKFDGGRAGF